MTRSIFLDLDGTLIDPKKRIYRLFCDLTALPISFDDYWVLKQYKVNHEIILSQSFGWQNEAISLFKKEWFENIESKNYLLHDSIFDYSERVLKALANRYLLTLITSRKNRINLLSQLEEFRINQYFTSVYNTGNYESKIHFLTNSNISKINYDWIIGDSGEDIQIASESNIKSFAVLSGLRAKVILESYHPDFIGNNIVDFLNLVEKDDPLS